MFYQEAEFLNINTQLYEEFLLKFSIREDLKKSFQTSLTDSYIYLWSLQIKKIKLD